MTEGTGQDSRGLHPGKNAERSEHKQQPLAGEGERRSQKDFYTFLVQPVRVQEKDQVIQPR